MAPLSREAIGLVWVLYVRRRAALERCHVRVIEVPLIKSRILDLAFQSNNHRMREIYVLKTLCIPQPTRAKHVDFHQLITSYVQPNKEHPIENEFRADNLGYP